MAAMTGQAKGLSRRPTGMESPFGSVAGSPYLQAFSAVVIAAVIPDSEKA